MKEHYVSKEMIIRAQQLRRDTGITLQRIVDEAENIKMPVSMSTVRRFFAEDATNHRFSADAVQGIFAVLGHTNDRTESGTTPEEVDFLKEIITFDRTLIEQLDAKIASLRSQHETEIKTMRCAHSEEIFKIATENQRKLEFIKSTVEDFKKQIEIKDRRMDQRDTHFLQQIELKDRRYDSLLEKYDELNKKYSELLSLHADGGTK